MERKYKRIHCGRLYDGVTEEWKENRQILVEDRRIAAVGESVPAPEGTEEIDLSAYQVTPGLIDAHMHMSVRRSIRPRKNPKRWRLPAAPRRRCREASPRCAMWAASPARATACWM